MRDITDASILSILAIKTDNQTRKLAHAFTELSNILKDIRQQQETTRIFLTTMSIIYDAEADRFYLYV